MKRGGESDRAYEVEEYLDLTIIDNGCGMEDPKQAIQFFSSQKKGQNMRTKGKYGVGLTTCLLYSQLSTGQPIRIASKTIDQSKCTVLNINFDIENGHPIIEEESVEIDSTTFLSGTKICLSLPSIKLVNPVLETIQQYIYRYQALPTCMVSIKLNSSIVSNLSSEWATWPNKSRGELCTRDLGTYDEFLQISPFLTDRQSLDHSTIVKSSFMKDDEMQIMIISSLIICFGERGTDLEENSSGCPLMMWRYGNFCPLIDEAEDAMSCVFTTALREIPWSQFGHKLQLSDVPGSQGLQWKLIPLPDALRENEEPLHDILVVINISSPSVPYANMRKTSIEQHPKILKLSVAAICKALMEIKYSNEQFSVLFASRLQRLRAITLKTYVPLIASSVNRIISKNQTLEKIILEKLGLSIGEDESILNQYIERLMIEILEKKDTVG